MAALMVFRSVLVNQLRSSIRANLHKYRRDDAWVTEIAPRDLPTTIVPRGLLQLDSPEGSDLKDTENAMCLHRTLDGLTPLQARDPRLWTRLTHMEFWSYMRLRWPVERHWQDSDKAVRFIDSRYFVPQNQSRALLRNGIARLWWTAQLSSDSNRASPYEMTAVLLSALDITQQILERGMGRASNVLWGFLEFLMENRSTLLTGGNRNRMRIRRLAKRLNMHGGVCLLDLLGRSEVKALLAIELDRILAEEARVSEGKEVAS
jgi:hypothetical protein